MPIYAYRCSSCGHAQDVLQKISDPVLTVCPACGVASYAKQLTAAGFQLKGSGWYVTDFRGGNTAGKAPAQEGGAEASKDGGAGAAAAEGAKAATPATDKAAAAVPSEAAKPVAAAPAPTPTPGTPKTGA